MKNKLTIISVSLVVVGEFGKRKVLIFALLAKWQNEKNELTRTRVKRNEAKAKAHARQRNATKGKKPVRHTQLYSAVVWDIVCDFVIENFWSIQLTQTQSE